MNPRELINRAAKVEASRFFQWDNLATLGASPLAAVGLYGLLVVPVIASLLKLIEVVGLTVNISLSVFLPFPMIAAYLASLLFFVASILVSIYCPRNIQRFKNFDAFEFALLEKCANIISMKKQVSEIKSPTDSTASVLKIDNIDDYKKFMPDIVDQAVKDDLAEEIEAELGRASTLWANLLLKYPRIRLLIGAQFLVAIGMFALILVIYMPAVVFGII